VGRSLSETDFLGPLRVPLSWSMIHALSLLSLTNSQVRNREPTCISKNALIVLGGGAVSPESE